MTLSCNTRRNVRPAATRAPMGIAEGVIVFAVLTGVVASVGAAEPVPYGHPDFYPSATRPAGLRGDGSGKFPAATPVTKWDWTTGENIVRATPLPSCCPCGWPGGN